MSAFALVRKHDGVRIDRYKLINFYGEGGLKVATTKFQLAAVYREHRVLELLKKVDDITEQPAINYNELYDLKTGSQRNEHWYGKSSYEKVTRDLHTKLDTSEKT